MTVTRLSYYEALRSVPSFAQIGFALGCNVRFVNTDMGVGVWDIVSLVSSADVGVVMVLQQGSRQRTFLLPQGGLGEVIHEDVSGQRVSKIHPATDADRERPAPAGREAEHGGDAGGGGDGSRPGTPGQKRRVRGHTGKGG